MKKISTSLTFLNKRIFPLFWFGMLAVMFLVAGTQDLVSLIPLVGMFTVGFILFRKMVWDLADEVYDCGPHLIVRKGDEEDLVPLTNIMNVSVSSFHNPPRITLRLITPGRFGPEIAFSPTIVFTFNPFAKNAVAEDLIQRVHQERLKRGRV